MVWIVCAWACAGFDVCGQDLVHTFSQDTLTVPLAFSAGDTLLAGTDAGGIAVWELATGKELGWLPSNGALSR